MASNGLVRSKKRATGRGEMHGKHTSSRRRPRLASQWYLYYKILQIKLPLI
jgi:hypothetical protein